MGNETVYWDGLICSFWKLAEDEFDKDRSLFLNKTADKLGFEELFSFQVWRLWNVPVFVSVNILLLLQLRATPQQKEATGYF